MLFRSCYKLLYSQILSSITMPLIQEDLLYCLTRINAMNTPGNDGIKDERVVKALRLLMMGDCKDCTEKALNNFYDCLKNGCRAPEVKAELYRAAELVYQGKIESSDRIMDASRIIQIAERLDGWRMPFRLSETDRKTQEFVAIIYSELEKERKKRRFHDKYPDTGELGGSRSLRKPDLGETAVLYFDSADTIDSMQFCIEWIHQGFAVFSGKKDREIYENKLIEAMGDGSIAKDQLIHHLDRKSVV